MPSDFRCTVTPLRRSWHGAVRNAAVPSLTPTHPGMGHGFGGGGSLRQDFCEVFVAPAAEADEHMFLAELACARERMRRLERGDDPFAACQVAECGQGILVRGAHVLGTSAVAQPRVFGSDAGIVESGG